MKGAPLKKYSSRKINGKKYYYEYVLDLFGKRKQLTAPTEKELDEKIIKHEQEVRMSCNPSKEHFATYLRNWLRNVHYLQLKETTIERYEAVLHNQIEGSEIAEIPVKDLTVDIMQTFYNRLYGRTSEATTKSVHKVVSPCLRYAYGKGDIVRDFSRQLVVPKNRNKNSDTVHPLTRAEQMIFVRYISGTRDEAIFRMALDGGYRKGELLALTWNDVDLESRSVQIDKTYSYVKDLNTGKYKGVTTAPKTKNSKRKNRIPKSLMPILERHKEMQKQELLTNGIHQGGDTLVFSTELGKHLDTSGINKRLKRVFAELGFDSKKHFHDLRHTYATRQFEMGKDNLDYTVVVVSKLLGHCNVKETLETYTTVLDDLRDAMADNTDLLYEEMSGKKENIIQLNKVCC